MPLTVTLLACTASTVVLLTFNTSLVDTTRCVTWADCALAHCSYVYLQLYNRVFRRTHARRSYYQFPVNLLPAYARFRHTLLVYVILIRFCGITCIAITGFGTPYWFRLPDARLPPLPAALICRFSRYPPPPTLPAFSGCRVISTAALRTFHPYLPHAIPILPGAHFVRPSLTHPSVRFYAVAGYWLNTQAR